MSTRGLLRIATERWTTRMKAHSMLLFVVARSRLNLYEELRRHFEDWRDVRIVLDRREGERRTPHGMFARADRRRVERRHRYPDLRKLGWSVVDTDEPNS